MKKLLLLIGMILFGVMPSCAQEIHFAVVSDVHYNAAAKDGDLANTGKVLNGFVDRVNENDYDFVVFLGDNIDKSRINNLNGFFKYTSKIKRTPYYLVLGEHDAHKISGIAKPEFLAVVAKHNKSQKKAQPSYYFCPTPEVIAIVLDGSSSGLPSTHGVFTQKTLQWLDEVLTKNKNKKAIIFQHFPFVEPYTKESHRILEKMDYKTVLNKHDNVFAIISGHYHKESLVKDERGVYHVSLPAVYLPPYDYQEITVTYEKKLFDKPKNFVLKNVQKPAI